MKTLALSLVAVALATTLSTSVSFAQSSDAAAATSPSAQPTPKQTRQANHALVKRVRTALDKTQGLDSTDITVLAKGGSVSLEGTVPEQQQIALAESTARSVSGVKSLKSFLRMEIKN